MIQLFWSYKFYCDGQSGTPGNVLRADISEIACTQLQLFRPKVSYNQTSENVCRLQLSSTMIHISENLSAGSVYISNGSDVRKSLNFGLVRFSTATSLLNRAFSTCVYSWDLLVAQ